MKGRKLGKTRAIVNGAIADIELCGSAASRG